MAGRVKMVDLSGYRDVDVRSIVMRETCANDTMDAAGRSLPPDGKEINPQEFGLEMRIQSVSQSIVEFVDLGGKRVVSNGHCPEYRTWSNRTREFVGDIYDHLNGMTQKEREGFQKALEVREPATRGGGSSADMSTSGSGSPGT